MLFKAATSRFLLDVMQSSAVKTPWALLSAQEKLKNLSPA